MSHLTETVIPPPLLEAPNEGGPRIPHERPSDYVYDISYAHQENYARVHSLSLGYNLDI